jgi:hypothetical protein
VNPAMSSAPAWRYDNPTTPIWSMAASHHGPGPGVSPNGHRVRQRRTVVRQ